MTPGSVWFVVWRLGDVGGMERHVCDLATALAHRGTRVTLFVEQPLAPGNRYANAMRAAGIAIVAPSRATRWSMRVEHRWLYRRATAWRRQSPATSALLRALDRHARQTSPDVVHVHGCRLAQSHVLAWARTRGIPVAYTEHVTIDDWQGPYDAASPAFFDDAAAAIACVSERSRDSLARYIRSPIALAAHIVPDPALPPIAPSPDGRLHLLSVGRLETYKGHHILLQAAAMLRDAGVPFALVIAGDGEERGALEALRRDLRLERQVAFAGLVDQEAIPQLWADADVGVLPSLTEGLPIALIEGMAARRPMIASDTGGVCEAMTDGVEGLLVPAGNAEALAAAIARCADWALVARMGQAARSRYECGGWSARNAVEQAGQLYDAARTLRRERDEPPKVAMCLYRLATHGGMEHRVMRQAIALAEVGSPVTLHVERPIRPRNPYRRAMRRAGVDVKAPTLIGWLIGQGWATATRGAGGLPRALARTLERDRPSVVHVHGWRLGAGWRALDRIAPLLISYDIIRVFEEHAASIEVTAAGSPVVRSFDIMITPSSVAADGIAKALDGDHPPIAVLDALDESPRAPATRPASAGRINVFALVDPAARDRLATMYDVVMVEDPADADAVVLKPSLPDYVTAMGAAMASFKPIILTERDPTGAIRHRVEGLVADDLANAVETIRTDSLLVRQLSIAARRTYVAKGYDLPIIAEQLTRLYRQPASPVELHLADLVMADAA